MKTTRRQAHLLILLAISFFLFFGSFVLDQAFRWTDPIEGIRSALIQAFVPSIIWIVYGLAPGLLIYGFFRWRGWQRFRTVAILSPAIVASCLVIEGLVFDRDTPARRLKSITGAQFPISADDLKTHLTGGGVADYEDTYYFRCSPADTDTLIRTLGLTPADKYDDDLLSTRPFPNWPDPSMWVGSTVYRGGKDGWFYHLRTDASHEEIYLVVGSF